MSILYFIPRYDPALMGNRIHAEVIEAWRTRDIDAEVITLTAGIGRIESTVHDGIVVHRLPEAHRAIGTRFAHVAPGYLHTQRAILGHIRGRA